MFCPFHQVGHLQPIQSSSASLAFAAHAAEVSVFLTSCIARSAVNCYKGIKLYFNALVRRSGQPWLPEPAMMLAQTIRCLLTFTMCRTVCSSALSCQSRVHVIKLWGLSSLLFHGDDVVGNLQQCPLSWLAHSLHANLCMCACKLSLA